MLSRLREGGVASKARECGFIGFIGEESGKFLSCDSFFSTMLIKCGYDWPHREARYDQL